MPRTSKSGDKLQYPPGVKEISEDLSTDDLVRRLHDCALAFQNMSQDEDNSAYIPLALYLATEFFIEHNSRDVRILVACSIADVFRVYAPDAPYKDPDLLKVIFELFIQQLKGLEDTKDPLFKRYFYLLENLAWVKSFNICIELEDNQKIFRQLFSVLFRTVNDSHSVKVKGFMLDLMSPLITEADTVSQELLDVILLQIIEPRKTQNKNAYVLAQNLLKKTSMTIEPYLQNFFNNVLILGKTSQSEVAGHFYELIYELNRICPSMLFSVLPQLEFKLKSNEEKERMDVTKVLATMFSDKESLLVQQNKQLWICFLGRFNDISHQVRARCVKYSLNFLLNHPELTEDITEQLKQRQHDPEESVRCEVVTAVIGAAKKDLNCVNEELLSFVKERTLDKKFKIRKEALLGLATLYKQYANSADIADSTRECISWIKNKVLHAYYQTSLEDRLLVERILHTCLVPYQDNTEDRMKKLYHLYSTVDDHAVKAFNELLKCQHIVRTQVRGLLECIQREKGNSKEKLISCKVAQLSKNLPDSTKAQESILKFSNSLENNLRVRNLLSALLGERVSCSEAASNVKEILKTLGPPVQHNTVYMTIKQLLERVAPVMIDKDGIKHLIYCVKDSVIEAGQIDYQLGISNSSCRGLQLLHTLSYVFSGAFQDEEALNDLLLILQASDDEQAVDMALQILCNICVGVEKAFPKFSERLIPVLENFVEMGTPKQAKHAVYCLNAAVSNKDTVFGSIISALSKHFTLDSQYFRTALVSVGHIACLCPDLFGTQLKSIVSKIVVKQLLMLDQDLPRGGDDVWGPLDSLPDETKVKIEGMKLMVRWLVGLKDSVQAAVSTLKLLGTVIMHKGDLMERQHAAPMETSWLRFTAATCMLKLCQEKNYVDSITLEQFQVLAFVVRDEVKEVREKFVQKLHKGLIGLKLPLEFMGIFAVCGLEEHQELKVQAKQYLVSNITKRREFLKQNPVSPSKIYSFLPDYVLPFAIHLLAHAPFLESYDDVPSLTKVKECLWFLMEPLMVKSENYSFSFFKRLIENIKQTKDVQNPADEAANMKLYAVCDLALGIVISKTTNFVLKDFPAEPCLPTKLYTSPDKKFNNMKNYLPPELITAPPKRSGFDIEISNGPSKGDNSSVTTSEAKKSITANDSKVNNVSAETKSRGNSKSNHLSHFNKTLDGKEVESGESLNMINSTEGLENKAPEDNSVTPSQQSKPRGRPRKISQPAEESGKVDNSITSDSSASSGRPRGRSKRDFQPPPGDSSCENVGDRKNQSSTEPRPRGRPRKISQPNTETSSSPSVCEDSSSSTQTTKLGSKNIVKINRVRRTQQIKNSNHVSHRAGKGASEISDSEHSSVDIDSSVSSVPSKSETVVNKRNLELENENSAEKLEPLRTSNSKRLSDTKIERYFQPKRLSQSLVGSKLQKPLSGKGKISLSSSKNFGGNKNVPKKGGSDKSTIHNNCDTHTEQSTVLKARKTFHQKQVKLNTLNSDISGSENSSPARVPDCFLERTVSVILHRNAEIDSLSSQSFSSDASPSVKRIKSLGTIKKPLGHSAVLHKLKRKSSGSPIRSPVEPKRLKISKLMKFQKLTKVTQKLKQKSSNSSSATNDKVSRVKSAKDTSKVPKQIKKPANKEIISKPQASPRSAVKQQDKKKVKTVLPSKSVTKVLKVKRSDSHNSPTKKPQKVKAVKAKPVVAKVSSDEKISSPARSLQKSTKQKSMKMSPVANGIDKKKKKKEVAVSPSKNRSTAAALLAKAIRSSSLKSRSPKVKQVSKSKR